MRKKVKEGEGVQDFKRAKRGMGTKKQDVFFSYGKDDYDGDDDDDENDDATRRLETTINSRADAFPFGQKRQERSPRTFYDVNPSYL